MLPDNFVSHGVYIPIPVFVCVASNGAEGCGGGRRGWFLLCRLSH